MNSPERQDEFGAADWTEKILQSLVCATTADDAAVVAAAAWLTFGNVDAAIAVLFVTSTQCAVARAERDSNGGVRVSTGMQRAPIAALLDDGRLATLVAVNHPSVKSRWIAWPQHLAACFVDRFDESTDGLTERLVDQILSRTVSPQSLIPSSDRLEALAEFAAGAGHEINNPLGSIIGQTQLLLKSEQQTDRRQALSTIGSQAWRIRDMIGDCMLYARPPAPDFLDCLLNELVRHSAENAALALQEPLSKVRLKFSSENITARVDAAQFVTLVSHLVRNALEAGRDAGVDSAVIVELTYDSGAIVLTVTDRGSEIADESVRRHLFDPCFSGRQAGRGMGFGLPVCWQIVRNHGGLLLQETPADGGNRFFVAIPASDR